MKSISGCIWDKIVAFRIADFRQENHLAET